MRWLILIAFMISFGVMIFPGSNAATSVNGTLTLTVVNASNATNESSVNVSLPVVIEEDRGRGSGFRSEPFIIEDYVEEFEESSPAAIEEVQEDERSEKGSGRSEGENIIPTFEKVSPEYIERGLERYRVQVYIFLILAILLLSYWIFFLKNRS